MFGSINYKRLSVFCQQMVKKCFKNGSYAGRSEINLLKDVFLLFKRDGSIKSVRRLLLISYYIFLAKRTFVFNKREYHYFYHLYGYTLDSERAVEVPIIMREVDAYKGKRILEVGNVLSHFYRLRRDVVDKFEKMVGVINQDIVKFKPKEKYDLIVSISTLEHVGLDDTTKDPRGTLKALRNLKQNCLKRNGKIVVTLPLGYNKEMDRLLFASKLGFSSVYFLKRVSGDNRWKQVSKDEGRKIRYDFPFRHGNGVVVAVWEG